MNATVKPGYDFCGWATKNDLKCSDGRIIRRNAFRVDDGKKVPLVWNHQHNSPGDVLGHALLENREEGVFMHGKFNNTRAGLEAKACVMNGDVTHLSIWANNLQQNGPDVLHGAIREVSLVLAGANPGAYIESVMAHGDPMEDYDDEGLFYTNEPLIIQHSECSPEKKKELEHTKEGGTQPMATERTLGQIVDTMNEEQKQALHAMVGLALQSSEDEKKKNEEDTEMKHNVFDNDSGSGQETKILSHSDMETIFKDARRCGSLREAVSENIDGGILVHGIPNVPTDGMTTHTGNQNYGINDASMLFPDYRSLNTPPEFIGRDMGWVRVVMSGVHRTPFSRIKSMFANITEDEARARGYIKGNQKKSEVFTTLKRTTDPQTIYKKQQLDRDDVIDITDFNVVAWIRGEMRLMLDEEIARAILFGDGRPSDSDDKISEDHVRPIATDKPLFNTKIEVDYTQLGAKGFITSAIKGRKYYKGSGNPILFTTEDVLTDMLLLEDGIGHKMYKTEAELATALRVSKIVTVEAMEGATIDGAPLLGIAVNMNDYNVGADKGGEINMFDDFDIDYNQMKYLIETRISGALTKPFSALTFLGKKA